MPSQTSYGHSALAETLGPVRRPAVPRLILLAAVALALAGGLYIGLVGSRPAPAPAVFGEARGLSSLPAAAQGQISAALGADTRAYGLAQTTGGLQGSNPAQRLRLRFGTGGVSVSSGVGTFGLRLEAVGYGNALRPVGEVTPSATANRVTYRHAGLSEWYANGPLGLEQGFEIRHAGPAHSDGPLTLSMAVTGNTRLATDEARSGITITHRGMAPLVYDQLRVTDQRGRVLSSALALRGDRLQLTIDTRGARFPLQVDPFIQQGEKLVAGDEVRKAQFGYSVALSADGNTALIGGPTDRTIGTVSGPGAAWVFTRSGLTWTEQTKLEGQRNECCDTEFGRSVALSADGNTAAVGEPYFFGSYGESGGAVLVFTRSGSTWSRQAALMGRGESTRADFGESVALSADGGTLLAGGRANGLNNPWPGAAWFFKRSGSTWAQQGEIVTVSGAVEFGVSVALSEDASTALILAKGGGAYVYAATGEGWSRQAALSTPAFARSGALSADGDTALVGSPASGEALVFARSGTSWSPVPSITPTGHSQGFGETVALSSDGDTAFIGETVDNEYDGAVWVYARAGEQWTPEGERLTPPEAVAPAGFGKGIALSADGTVALIGGPGDSGSVGAAWTFSSRPGAPIVATEAAAAVTQTTATLTASVTPDGEAVSDCHFEYGPTASYGTNVPCASLPGSGTSPVAVSAGIEGLTLNTPYHYRIVATNGKGTTIGSDVTFTTLPNPPTPTTTAASSVAFNSATLNGTVNPDGANVSDCHFEYGPTTSYGASIPCSASPGAGESPVAVSAPLGGIDPNSTYHYRLVATNGGGTSYGGDEEFATPPGQPAVTTGPASSVTESSAALNGTVNPEGANVSDCHFEYGTSTEYGSSVPCSTPPGSGVSAVEAAATVQGLAAGVTYHFRIVATNPVGTGYGADRTFAALSRAPQFGRCVKVAAGAGTFEGANCTKPGGTKKYEWYPGVVRPHFTIDIKEGSVTLETIKAVRVTCTGEAGSGEYSGAKTVGGVVLTFTGCEQGGAKCSSLAAGEGDIVTNPLEGALGVTKPGATNILNAIGLDLQPSGGTGAVAQFSCGLVTATVRGSVIVPVQRNGMKLTSTLVFAQSKGKQKLQSFLEAPKDILEASFGEGPYVQAGLGLKATQTNEEKIEINSVV